VANDARRPLGITLLIVFVVIQGLVSVVNGLTVLSKRNDFSFLHDNGMTKGAVTWGAIAAIGLGIFVILVGLGLGTGSGVARFLVGLFSVLEVAVGVYGIANYSGIQQQSAVLILVVALVVLYLLYGSRRNRAFFANN
jgi:hypothetical protein